MKTLDRIVSDRRLLLGTVVLILLVATLARFYHIEWSFSNNGIDEGIMIERARLVGDGYALYSELPCDQAPLAFYLGGPFGGDIVSLRSLSAVISILAVVAVMESARRVGGKVAMLAAGLLISFDFAFLRESRLFSLDGITSSFLAFSLLAFVVYLEKKSRPMLVASGLFVGLSAASKLFGALGLLGMIVFLIVDWRKERRPPKGPLTDLIIVIIASAIPLAAFMMYLGPSEVINGMVFNQGQRTFEPWLKLSLVAFFGLNLAYALPLVFAKKIWSMSRGTRFLLCVAVVIILFMVFQPLLMFHHLAVLSPPLAVLAGVFLADRYASKKDNHAIGHNRVISNKRDMSFPVATALFVVTVLVSAGLAGYGLVVQEEPPQMAIARDLRSISHEGDWIVCGDPLICAYADRSIPPEVVNVAYRQHPDVTIGDIEQAVSDYDVSVVVLSYRLARMDGLQEMLVEDGFSLVMPHNDPNWSLSWEDYHAALDFFQDDMGPVYIYWRGAT